MISFARIIHHMDIQIRLAQEENVVTMQELRKTGWQDNYVNPETGVTKEVLETELAVLPPSEKDIEFGKSRLKNPTDGDKNLVAIKDEKVIGAVFYETLENGNGDIGVFIDRSARGEGIGTSLLAALIEKTSNDIEVTIFAKNRSRGLYKKHGFVEDGEERTHIFREGVSLPIQKLILRRN